MEKGTRCKYASHQIFNDRVNNRVEGLQGMLMDLQGARKGRRGIGVAVYEEQVNQMVKEWKNECNQRSQTTSLQHAANIELSYPNIGSFCSYAMRISFHKN